MIDISRLFEKKPFYLINADCLEVLRKLPNESLDLILIDPPYNLGRFIRQRNTNLQTMRPNFFGAAGWDDLEFEEWEKMIDVFFAECARVSKVGAAMILFMSIIKVETIVQLAVKHGFYYKTTGIWHKSNPIPRNMNLHFINSTEAWIYFVYKKHTGVFSNHRKAVHDFFETSITSSREKKYGKHPTQKPVVLLEQFVTLLSQKGDVVCDPFMGSGSSGVAALLHGRKFIGADIDSNYCEISIKRMDEVWKQNEQ